jgi:hypothetical protein
MAKQKDIKRITYTQTEYNNKKWAEDRDKFFEEYKNKYPNRDPKIKYKAISNSPSTIDNPLSDAPYNSVFMLHTKSPTYYIRFGYLLEYIKENILPRVKISDDHSTNPPIFDIDTDQWRNYMYSLPNQISLDPRICIVRNSNFDSSKGNTQIFQELEIFRSVDGGKSKNYNVAYPMNIYLNFDFVTSSLSKDDRGDVNLFEFLSNICTGLNKALGGINNLEPTIDESSNTLKITETTPIPGISKSNKTPYTLQLYGYHKSGNNYISNFIRKVDLKTAITPEYATMITVGATAGGYVKGTEATAFSKWNTGLIDRYKEDFTPGNKASIKIEGETDEAEFNYVEKFLEEGYFKRYGTPTFSPNSFILVDDIIESNISVVTEYYKYLLSKNKATSGGTIGFIPFKLSLTMDGLSGIKIYNKLNVNTEFLPKTYGDNMDLIITGVNHRLSDNDWETNLETTVIPKVGALSLIEITPNVIQDSINNVGKAINGAQITSCNQLPPAKGLSSSVKGIIKASTTKDSTIIQAIVDNLEGGYYHPTHAYSSKTNTILPNYDIYKNSGETLYGIDRFAGNTEGIRQGPLNPIGVAFWSAVDAISGFGAYKNAARITKTGKWDIKKYPKKPTAWNHYDKPKKSDPGYNTLQTNLQKYMISQFTAFSNIYFGNHPLGKLVESDGRLKFLFYRAAWNGVDFFKNYANNLKAVYDKGERDIDKLICADLTFRYNKKSSNFKPGVSKMAYMIDYKKP